MEYDLFEQEASDRERFYMEKQEKAALLLGATAIPATFFVPILLPFLMGSVAIVFAILAKGGNRKLGKNGRRAVLLASAAIVINIGYLVFTLWTVKSMLTNPSGRQELSDMLYRMYGLSLEDFLSQTGLPQTWP